MNGGVQNRLLPTFPPGPINQLIWWRAGPTGKGVPEIQMAEPEGLGVACCRGGSGLWGSSSLGGTALDATAVG